MNLKNLSLVIFAALLSFTAKAQTHHDADTAKNTSAYITSSVMVDGLVEHPLNLTVADLQKMKAVELNDYTILGKGGAVKGHFNSVKGVLLKDVLTMAGITVAELKQSGQLFVVASAADGFEVVFSWAELFNTPNGDHVFVVYQEDGKPIEKEGQITIFTDIDKINGIRHVKWLKALTVKKAG